MIAVVGDMAQDGWVLIGLPALVALLTALATTAVARSNAAADRRRVRYAEAVATLVAWIELPYRVRRRTSDDPTTLTALADRGHELQERMAFDQAWINTQSVDVGEAYKEARVSIGPLVGGAVRSAWDSPPVTSPSEMNLDDWGPAPSCSDHVAQLEKQINRRLTRWNPFRRLVN